LIEVDAVSIVNPASIDCTAIVVDGGSARSRGRLTVEPVRTTSSPPE
jgi:hypothetical protein